MKTLKSSFQALVDALSRLGCVRAIGKTGGLDLPKDGFGDIDLFVLCERLPARAEREALYLSIADTCSVEEYGETEHPHWGLVDSLLLDGTETYPMFFSKDAFSESIHSILRGERTEREANYFYPTGRCASILGMFFCYDPDGIFEQLKQLCAIYPDLLRNALMGAHMSKINDEEDFQRAIRRGDVLFFHSTLDLALDHFLQVLFALNRVYFPSRKRSLEKIRAFQRKPKNCENRLLQIIELGARANSLAYAYRDWQILCAELTELFEAQCE